MVSESVSASQVTPAHTTHRDPAALVVVDVGTPPAGHFPSDTPQPSDDTARNHHRTIITFSAHERLNAAEGAVLTAPESRRSGHDLISSASVADVLLVETAVAAPSTAAPATRPRSATAGPCTKLDGAPPHDDDPCDFATLESVMRVLERTVPQVRINPAQCRVLFRRLQIIFDTLVRMPKRDPTPQLLSTFRSAEYTVGRMHAAEEWKVLLKQSFTCAPLFECLRKRIRAVWQLHSTVNWEKEDKAALQRDEVFNVALIIQNAKELAAPSLLDELDMQSSRRPQDDSSAFGGSPSRAPDTATLQLCEETPEQVSAVLHFYRRRFASSWKVAPAELVAACAVDDSCSASPSLLERFERGPPKHNHEETTVTASFASTTFSVTDTVGGNVPLPQGLSSASFSVGRSSHSFVEMPQLSDVELRTTTKSGGTPPLARRFAVRRECLEFRGHRVVVKRLKDAALITPGTLESFVIDVSCRVRWSHPNLVPCHGGFCEEFEEGSDGVPFLSLGMLMTDMTHLHYVPLQTLLYEHGRRYSVLDAISISLHVSDALQFALFDEEEVGPEVLAAWKCVSPSNIFIAEHPRLNSASATVRSRLGVSYAPPLHIENGPVSRWTPHPLAVCPEVYALTQLFLALLTNQQPYSDVTCQVQLAGVFRQLSAQVPSTVTTPANPDGLGIRVPRTLPAPVQQFCRLGLALAGSAAVPGVPPINSLHRFRSGLHALRHVAKTLPPLPSGDAAVTSFVVEAPVDDYGWMEQRLFDEHAV